MKSHRVLLLGVDKATSDKIAKACAKHRIETTGGRSVDQALASIEKVRPDLVCVPADPEFYTSLNRVLTARGLRVPFIVVSEKLDAKEWRAAVEGGAADCFGGPFEGRYVETIFRNALAAPMAAFLQFHPAVL